MTEPGKRNVKSALCEIVLPVISLSVSSTDQEDADEFDSPLRFVQLLFFYLDFLCAALFICFLLLWRELCIRIATDKRSNMSEL